MARGKVWLVGAGPGDPGLITARGLELLRGADVVLHDSLAHPSLLVEAHGEVRDVGKRYGVESPTQSSINEQLVALARAGKRVVRLKGGDPFLFARGGEEAEALADAGIPFEVVPGVPSPVGAAAYAGMSLTHRELSSSVTFITGSDRAGEEWSPAAWQKLATATDTICVLMGMRRLEEILAAIIAGGRPGDTPAAVIQWGARPEQRVVTATLETLAPLARTAGLSNPAIIVVGAIVQLRDRLRWYDSRPLFGKRVLVPRAAHQATVTAHAIRERAALPVLFPVIEIHDPPDVERLRRAARAVDDYSWVVFTSVNGVERFFSALKDVGRDARAFGRSRIAVIGPKTGDALEAHGLVADRVAEEFVGESLAAALTAEGERGRVLIPRALVAREELPAALRAAGFEVDVVPAYRTEPASSARAGELRRLLEEQLVDVVLFTSGSTVVSSCQLLGENAAKLLSTATVASIGPITTRAAREHGIEPAVTASEFTVDGLLDALEAHLAAPAVG